MYLTNNSFFQRISCNYQQGFFAKVIEVQIDIYSIDSVDADELECSADGVHCDGFINIKYHQGKADPIPYKKVSEDVQKQLTKIYKKSPIESQNTFIVTIDHKEAMKLSHLEMKAWRRNGKEVDRNNSTSLCRQCPMSHCDSRGQRLNHF